MNKIKISAVILNDHQRKMEKTLASLGWCDEVIVWTKPINGDWARARNEAMAAARNDWVLFVDSDEAVSDPITTLDESLNGYYLKRVDEFWGRKITHGEAGSVRLLRLGKKSAGKWVRKVHEFWEIKNAQELTSTFLVHHPHPNLRSFLEQINRYTEIDAGELLKEGKKFSCFRLLANPAGKFLQNYFLKGGFLDGLPGFVYAFMMSFYSLVVRVKMWERNGL